MTNRNETENQLYTALFIAIDQEDPIRIQKILQDSHISIHQNINSPNAADELTPLRYALTHKRSSIAVQTLLSYHMNSLNNQNNHSNPTDVSQLHSTNESIINELIHEIFPIAQIVHPQIGNGTTCADQNISSVISRVEKAIEAIRRGDFVVVFDREDRENEGDLIIAAEKATPEKIAFMVNETSGIICVGITEERTKELELNQMVVRNTESHQTAFTVSVDYRLGTATGISAADRALTMRKLADPTVKPEDFARPGHIFPLRAKAGGVLERPGHTEASVDLARLAGLYPAGAMCEIVLKDGSMARQSYLRAWAARNHIECITITELIEYRKTTQQ